VHERGAIIFAIIETVATLAAIYAFVLRRPRRRDEDGTPSWLEDRDWDPEVVLDRLTLRHDTRQSS
jgi:hypothetical protein